MIALGAQGVVAAAMAVSWALAFFKLWATLEVGSSVMLSMLVHTLIDASMQALLLLGLHRAAGVDGKSIPADSSRDLGFWCFVAATPLYAMGAGVVLYEGVERMARPLATTGSRLELAVTGIAAALAVGVAWLAWQELGISRAERRTVLPVLRQARHAPMLVILIQSVAAYVAALIALCGVVVGRHGGVMEASGAASLMIGLVLIAVAAAMAIEVRRLLGPMPLRPAEDEPAAREPAAAEPSPPEKQEDSLSPEEPEAEEVGGSVRELGPTLKPRLLARPRTAKRHGKRRH